MNSRFCNNWRCESCRRNLREAAARANAPVNATREGEARVAVIPPHSDAARAFAPGGVEVEASYPRGVIDLRRLTRN